jgi:hypothetical protein
MENIIDPQADFIFEAVAVDIDARGAVETKPTSDDPISSRWRGRLLRRATRTS